MIHILSWTTKEHQRTLSRPLHSELKKIHRTFQGKMEFKDFPRTFPKIQGLFKTACANPDNSSHDTQPHLLTVTSTS